MPEPARSLCETDLPISFVAVEPDCTLRTEAIELEEEEEGIGGLLCMPRALLSDHLGFVGVFVTEDR